MNDNITGRNWSLFALISVLVSKIFCIDFAYKNIAADVDCTLLFLFQSTL